MIKGAGSWRSRHPRTSDSVRDGWIEALRRIVGPDACLTSQAELYAYACDGLTLDPHHPAVVVLPRSTEEVAQVVRVCREAGQAFLPRGAGTGLSGGAHPLNDAVVISCARMNQILHLDPRDRLAVVQPGVVNADLSVAARSEGLFYAPDPSSQQACTIGGNVAENSGGPHTLKYGTTTNHILALELVLVLGLAWSGTWALPWSGPGEEVF